MIAAAALTVFATVWLPYIFQHMEVTVRLSLLSRTLLLGTLGATLVGAPALAQAQAKAAAKPAAGQATDPEFAKLVKEWTTRPEFISPLVDFLPLKKGIPTPKDVLGRYVGQPNRLTTTAEAYAYYRALEKASPRVKIVPMGKTD